MVNVRDGGKTLPSRCMLRLTLISCQIAKQSLLTLEIAHVYADFHSRQVGFGPVISSSTIQLKSAREFESGKELGPRAQARFDSRRVHLRVSRCWTLGIGVVLAAGHCCDDSGKFPCIPSSSLLEGSSS